MTAEHWIIIGAGSAGCVLANRLSADGTRLVTLIESGPDLVRGRVPAALEGSSFIDALALPDRTYPDLLARRTPDSELAVYQRGRGIGGSSAVNAMVALRGNPLIYERWGWHDLDPLWQRMEIPEIVAEADEIGEVDQALLAAHDAARLAPLTRREGRRVTSAEAYLWPALDRPNLSTRVNTTVDHVLIRDRKATGVRLADDTELTANHVVVSGGAIHSPALLLRSNIDTAGIGHHLQDHPSAMLTLQLKSQGAPGAQSPQTLAIASVLELEVDNDLVQLVPMSLLGSDAPGYGGLFVALMTPTSKAGTVTIDSSGSPQINFHLLHDKHDLDRLTKGVERALELLRHPAFEQIVEQVYIDDLGTTVDALTSGAAVGDWLRRRCADYVHATSTCAMGSVVDERYAVMGYEGLFVCDASIFPSIPDVNTHLPTTLAAERFARMHCSGS